MSTVYHESGLSKEAKAAHRALASMIEELEAVDWYNQRADAAEDEELRKILLHNRDEEIEHASMLLEWLRRKFPKFDEELKTYLFTEKSIVEIEEEEEEEEESSSGSGSGDLGIGS
ncbi:MAG: encapsulin-associated ferritin-like protein [Candidatus Aminicenantes bacterium]